LAPRERGLVEGIPFVQVAETQGPGGMGTSVSSSIMVEWPLPSHAGRWQSPGVGSLPTGPAAAGVVLHTPFVHTGSMQAPAGTGQSTAVKQPGLPPPVPAAVELDVLDVPPPPAGAWGAELQLSRKAMERTAGRTTASGIQEARITTPMVRYGTAGEEGRGEILLAPPTAARVLSRRRARWSGTSSR